MYRSKWASFATDRADGITWGTVVHLAQQHGYKTTHTHTHRRPVKLQKNIVSVLTEKLSDSRAFLQSVFADKKIRFFGLRADTGVGKSEQAIDFYFRGFGGLLTVPTTPTPVEWEEDDHASLVDCSPCRRRI